LPVTRNTVIRAETTGGGGFGDPLDREPERVLADVLNHYVSRKGALEDYGVVITDDDAVDAAATATLRAEMRKNAKAPPA
jgi:N-methylhydantoinase B